MAVKMLSSHTQKALNTHLRGPFLGCFFKHGWLAVCEPRRLVLSLKWMFGENPLKHVS